VGNFSHTSPTGKDLKKIPKNFNLKKINLKIKNKLKNKNKNN
jgi:hypothetical protein